MIRLQDIHLNYLDSDTPDLWTDGNLRIFRFGTKFVTCLAAPTIGDFINYYDWDRFVRRDFTDLVYFGTKANDYQRLFPGSQIELEAGTLYIKMPYVKQGFIQDQAFRINGRVRLLFHDLQDDYKTRIPENSEGFQIISQKARSNCFFQVPANHWFKVGIIAPCFENIDITSCVQGFPYARNTLENEGLFPSDGSSVSFPVDRVRLYPLTPVNQIIDPITLIAIPRLLAANPTTFYEEVGDGFSSVVRFKNIPKGCYLVSVYSNVAIGTVEQPVGFMFASSK